MSAGKIKVFIGNPPYFAIQDSVSNNNQSNCYAELNVRVRDTYVKHGVPSNNWGLYDPCFLGLRLASDTLGKNGVIAFVINGSFVDAGSFSGLRYCLLQEFSQVYCFNLRGNVRIGGQREGGNAFDDESTVAVAILILVRKEGEPLAQKIDYFETPDFLSYEGKMELLESFQGVADVPWQDVRPDKFNDWIHQRSTDIDYLLPMGIKKTKGRKDTRALFVLHSLGALTGRNSWATNYAADKVLSNMQATITEYNRHVQRILADPSLRTNNKRDLGTWMNGDMKQIRWTHALRDRLYRMSPLPPLDTSKIAVMQFKPFTKRKLYYEPTCFSSNYQQSKFFPLPDSENKVICIAGLNHRKGFGCLMVGRVPSSDFLEMSQTFPLYTYANGEKRINVSDHAHSVFANNYPALTITKEDIFYYAYGVLHSRECVDRFENDFRKSLARIPLAKNFQLFCWAGRRLADLHLNYESRVPNECFDVHIPKGKTKAEEFAYYRVKKMRFERSREGGKMKETIRYNDWISIRGIPDSAHRYILDDRSAIAWVMNQYQVSTDKDSGIINDPNDWCRDTGNPRYIFDLLLSVITVSIQTQEIVNAFPTENSFLPNSEVSL